MCLLAIALVGCERAAPKGRCTLEGQRSLGRHRAAQYDAVALSGEGAGSIAVWSDSTGTWARAGSEAEAPARRLDDACPGGIAVTTLHGAHWVGCVRPNPDEASSSVQLWRLSADLQRESSLLVGEAGRDGRGIALATHDSSLFVCWGEGKVGAPVVRLARFEATSRAGEALKLVRTQAASRPGYSGRDPALLVRGPEVLLSLSESELSPTSEVHRVLVARAFEAPQVVATVKVATPSPTLMSDARGVLLAYRDAASAKARPELHVARLDAALRLRGKPRRLGRANSEGGPVLAVCGTTRAAIAPVEHGGERYVAFHGLSDDLSVLEDNHQYYASGREFVLASAACGEHGVTALLAERSQPAEPSSELIQVDFRCAP